MKLNIDKNLLENLKIFGLTDKEITIYLTLLRTGPNTIMNLSRETGIKRSTTHNNVEELIKKGIVSQTNHGERRMVIAENVDKLKFLIEQRKWDIKKMEDNLPEVVRSIGALIPQASDGEKFEVKYYDGEVGVRSIYREVVNSKELKSYVNISRIFELFPENPQLFPENVDKGNLEMWEFIEDSDVSREYIKHINPKKYHYKFLPKTWNVAVFDYMMFDGKVAIISAKDDKPVGIIIDSYSIYESAKSLFNMMWDLVPEPK